MAANSTATMTSQVQTMADAFTAYMRTSLTAPPDRRYAPTTFSAAVLVHVRWRWLVYPLGLLLMGHFFLAATMFQTSRRAVRPWKGQRLPLLLADVDDIVCEFAAGGLHRRDGLRGPDPGADGVRWAGQGGLQAGQARVSIVIHLLIITSTRRGSP
jgi:hypothetical protein